MNKIFAGIIGLLLATTSVQAHADEHAQKKFIKQFDSAKKSKQLILESFNDLSQCAVGSCANDRATHICEQIAAVDIQTDYQISNSFTGQRSGAFTLNRADLALFKDLYASCRPTNYQYWNYDSLFHVGYAGDPEKAAAKLKQSLRLKKSAQPTGKTK